MSSSMDTIEVVGGVHAGTKRLQLKSVLERYGEIDICHKVGDPIQHIPWVRFVNASGARQAMDAIERQEVLIDGVAIKARWKPRGKDNLADERKGYTSRDIFMAEKERKGGGGGGGGGGSRALMQEKRRGSRSRSRSNGRRNARGGGGGGSRALMDDRPRDRDRGYDDRRRDDRYDDRRRDDRYDDRRYEDRGRGYDDRGRYDDRRYEDRRGDDRRDDRRDERRDDRPLAPGRFQLTARAQEADASEPLPSKPLPFEVYKPLEWQLVDIKDSDEVIAAAQVDQTAALVLAPCSSIRLRLAEGPVGINVPGRESWNVTAGPHITVSRVGPRGFKVTCIQVTPGPVRLQGQVSHVPSDVGPHGEIFVDNLTLWMRCSVPARVQAVAELDDFEHDVVDKEPRLALGVQRGQATDFRARFVDAFGRTIVNASEYMLRWSLSPSSKEGVAFQKAWLNINKKEISAFINVPADATVGATAKLGLEVSLPPSSLCHSMAALAALPLPTRDELPVVVAKKLELRWPGHPEKARFAMFKNLSVVVEAGYGTGRSRLEILSGHNIIEVLEASEICSEQQSVVPCVPALWIGSPCNTSKADDVQRWFLLPTGQGTASLAFWDPDLLGARPQPLEITIRAAKQLDLRLGEAWVSG
eukprot:symbB.v1.2.031744.t1/scaffold3487.1/size55659/7